MKEGIKRAVAISTLGLALTAPSVMAQDSVSLFAAGSLKDALTEVVSDYKKTNQLDVNTKFSPSRQLRNAIEEGEQADIFAAANMKYPRQLESEGWGGPVVMFTRNKLCALAQPEIETDTDSLLDTLLDEKVRVGAFSSQVDPSGDYAWELFAKAEIVKSGSFNKLSKKALTLKGSAKNDQATADQNQYAWAMSEKKTDILFTYCTNALQAQKEQPALQIIQLQPELLIGADYGLLVRKGASESAWDLGRYFLSPEGQKVLNAHGFMVMPREEKKETK